MKAATHGTALEDYENDVHRVRDALLRCVEINTESYKAPNNSAAHVAGP